MKQPNMRLIRAVVFIVLVVSVAIVLNRKDKPVSEPLTETKQTVFKELVVRREPELLKKPQREATTKLRRPKPIKSAKSAYHPYTETELRKLVKDYSTNESVIYNYSKSFLKYPSERSKQRLLKMMTKRERVLSQEKMFACFALAVKDSGKYGDRLIEAFREVYGQKVTPK